jgi:hypothetical protein
MQNIEGVYVANVTPMRDDASLSVDVDSYLAHVSWLSEIGVRGIVPFESPRPSHPRRNAGQPAGDPGDG